MTNDAPNTPEAPQMRGEADSIPPSGEAADRDSFPFWQARHSQYLPSPEECQLAASVHRWAAVADVISLGLLLPMLAPLVALQRGHGRTRGPFLLYHLNQSVLFQGMVFAVNLALALVFAVVTLLTCGVGAVLFILNLLPPLVAAVYALVMARAARRGLWRTYPWVGAKVLQAKIPWIRWG
ncbi:MAG: hypothetical protein ACPGUV_03600 [Polyangiales bacterium]